MENISYKLRLLITYITSLVIVSILIYNLLSTFSQSNVGTISKDNFKSTFLEREEFFNHFFYPYITTAKTVSQSEILKQYFLQNISHKNIEHYFLDIKKSLPYLTQVRFIDINGMEKIRIEGTSIDINKTNAISKIVPQNKLQNKFHRAYVQQFLSLKKGEVGFSEINLNIEHEKVSLPTKPTLRLGIPIYDTLNHKQGIFVLNISLKKFFQLLNKTTLYYVYLIDKKGIFLNHHNPKYGLVGENSNYSIFQEFPRHANKILQNDIYFGDMFSSYKLKNFNNSQDIKIILTLKYHKELTNRENVEGLFILMSIFFAILFLLTALYFSKLPDFLNNKVKQEKLMNKLTTLPNRLALMKDLASNQFQDSLVILISVNNIFKIQNTYGYEISNNLVTQFSHYLKGYKDVEKVYVNSYNIFALKYPYTNENNLQNFLHTFVKHIENNPFSINIDGNDVEFLIEITLGISNPKKLNNNIEELNEAENALDYALEHRHQIEIFSHISYENIKENEKNILLAKKIKKAIENDLIFIEVQPIYNNLTDKIEKYESLIRMKDGDTIIYPDTFLPIAKQINKYNLLSYIVIDKAFSYFQDKDYEFSINISILDIENIHFQEYLFERLKHYDISNKVVVEIVEQEGIENYDDFFNFVKKIKEHGCKVAIDDFGSGYSNYEYVINASEYIDYLKIDGSLIKDLPNNSKTQILVGSLKFLCDNLRIETIAEYVENEEVLKFVQSIGIDYSQGYYIGKPQREIIHVD